MVQLGKIKDMNFKKYLKTVIFQIGVDILGFPIFCKHQIEDYKLEDKKHVTKYHKSFHSTKKCCNELRLWHIKKLNT